MTLSLRSSSSGEKVAKQKIIATLCGHCSEGDKLGRDSSPDLGVKGSMADRVTVKWGFEG